MSIFELQQYYTSVNECVLLVIWMKLWRHLAAICFTFYSVQLFTYIIVEARDVNVNGHIGREAVRQALVDRF